MTLLGDRLNEFSQLKVVVPIQTLLFLLVCKELKPSFNETISDESSTVNKIESNKENANKNFKLCKTLRKSG